MDLSFTYRLLRPGISVPGEAPDPAGSFVSVEQAIEQQLGLKLQKARRPVPVFVIDHIEENPAEN